MVLAVSSYQEESVGMQVSWHNQSRYMITLLYAERETHPLPASVMLSAVPTGHVALIPLFQTVLHVFPLLASAHPCLGQPQLLRGFKAALDSGHLAFPWGGSRTNATSPWCLYPVHCGQAAPHGPPVPRDPLHRCMSSLLGSPCSTPLCPLQTHVPAHPPPA